MQKKKVKLEEKETISLLRCSAALRKRFQELFIEHSSQFRDLSRRSPGRKQLFQSLDMKHFPRDEIITIPNVFDMELITQSLVSMHFSIWPCSSHCLLNVCVSRLFFKRNTTITVLRHSKRKGRNVTWTQATKSCALRMWM